MYELKLSNINLSILDDNAFDELKDLQNLNISHNNMENTNFAISLSRLRRFHANNCEIKNSSEVIQYLGSNLGDLNLSGNFIGKLNLGSFKSLVKLWNNLSSTNLMNFKFDTLKIPLELALLDALHNKLSEVDFGMSPNYIEWV